MSPELFRNSLDRPPRARGFALPAPGTRVGKSVAGPCGWGCPGDGEPWPRRGRVRSPSRRSLSGPQGPGSCTRKRGLGRRRGADVGFYADTGRKSAHSGTFARCRIRTIKEPRDVEGTCPRRSLSSFKQRRPRGRSARGRAPVVHQWPGRYQA